MVSYFVLQGRGHSCKLVRLGHVHRHGLLHKDVLAFGGLRFGLGLGLGLGSGLGLGLGFSMKMCLPSLRNCRPISACSVKASETGVFGGG